MTEQPFDHLKDQFKDQTEKFLGPTRELNKLTLSKLEQLASMQLASLRDYTEMNMRQLRAATDISGPQDLQDFFAKQQDFLKTVGEKLAGDAQAMASIGREFAEEAQKIATKGMPNT
ncbi:MAG: phasin family protein [Rhodospirillaceae bacterium]|nr:phasin family protein [Rhodospirillaceae bacterium]MCA8933552.1 phasin family protein [Rhodospirillaceae bacterium]